MFFESSSSFKEALLSSGYREHSFGKFQGNDRVIGASYEHSSGCCLTLERVWVGPNMIRHQIRIHIDGEGSVFDETCGTETMARAWELLCSRGLTNEAPCPKTILPGCQAAADAPEHGSAGGHHKPEIVPDARVSYSPSSPSNAA